MSAVRILAFLVDKDQEDQEARFPGSQLTFQKSRNEGRSTQNPNREIERRFEEYAPTKQSEMEWNACRSHSRTKAVFFPCQFSSHSVGTYSHALGIRTGPVGVQAEVHCRRRVGHGRHRHRTITVQHRRTKKKAYFTTLNKLPEVDYIIVSMSPEIQAST